MNDNFMHHVLLHICCFSFSRAYLMNGISKVSGNNFNLILFCDSTKKYNCRLMSLDNTTKQWKILKVFVAFFLITQKLNKHLFQLPWKQNFVTPLPGKMKVIHSMYFKNMYFEKIFCEERVIRICFLLNHIKSLYLLFFQ